MAVGNHPVEFGLPHRPDAEDARGGRPGPALQRGGFDDVLVDDDGVPGVAAEDALPLPEPPPPADQPGDQAAGHQAQDDAQPPALVCSDVLQESTGEYTADSW